MKKRIRRFFKNLGPGFITGAADDDPSGIGTYAQTGAHFGYSQLWMALFTFPFMSTIQEMCGRIGIVTGKGLSGVLRKHYPKRFLYVAVSLLFFANAINIGADLGAMAATIRLLVDIPFNPLIIVMAASIVFLEIHFSYQTYARYLKYLTIALFSYIIVAFVIVQDWGAIFYSTFVPQFSLRKDYIVNVVAILGTTISPYLFFWQADEEVEEEVNHHKLRIFGRGIPIVTKKDIDAMRIDTVFGMLFSNIVMFFIIITTATTLGRMGITNIETADQAASALRPIAGEFAYLLFAAGIVGTGLLAIPILAGSAAYAIAEAFNWKAGLYRTFSHARGFYAVIIIATAVGLSINFLSIPPFKMLYYTAVINGICAPFLMFFILKIANNGEIMGKYVNTRVSNVLGWTITCVMFAAALALFAVLV